MVILLRIIQITRKENVAPLNGLFFSIRSKAHIISVQFNSLIAFCFTTHLHNVKQFLKTTTQKCTIYTYTEKGGSGLPYTNIFKKMIYTNLNNKVINNFPVVFCFLFY